MILYHFTDLYCLKNAGPNAILAVGLKAQDQSRHYPWMNGKLPPCVWFTSEPQPALLFERPPDVRLTVELSDLSKRLVSWPKWLRRHALLELFADSTREGLRPEDYYGPVITPDDVERTWREWYVYFGNVPLKAIRAVDYADTKRRAEVEDGGEK